MGTSVVYPRFLGIDENGDNVWELADGRWTWGDDPYDAASRSRTFAPDRYVEKYGAPRGLADLGTRLRTLRPGSVNPSPVQAEELPVLFGAEAVNAAVAEAFEDGKRRGAEEALAAAKTVKDTGGPLGVAGQRGAHRALTKMLLVLDGWIQGQQENHEALEHRHENRGDECWRSFAPSDVRSMVNDVARELGISEFPKPEVPQEDKPL